METSQFLLKWNNHQPTVVSVLDHLLSQEAFVDVTLACDGQSFSAHKVILSACSGYFQQLLMNTPCQHPIVVLKDVRARDLAALLQFMYRGEINVHQDDLAQFLRTAESLQIKGLADSAMKTEPEESGDPVFPSAAAGSTPTASSGGGGGSSSSRRSRHPAEPSLVSAADLTRPDPVTTELQQRSLGAAVGRSLLASALGHLVRPTLSADRSAGACGDTPASSASIVFPMELDTVNGAGKTSRVSPPISLAASPSPSLTASATLSAPLLSSGSRSRSPTPSPPTSAQTPLMTNQRLNSSSASTENGAENDDKTSDCGTLSRAGLSGYSEYFTEFSLDRDAQRESHVPSHNLNYYECNICGKFFNSRRRDRFMAHLRLHTGERPFKCNICGRGFNRQDHVTVHMRLHTGGKPFQCSKCKSRFAKMVQLKSHVCDGSASTSSDPSTSTSKSTLTHRSRGRASRAT